MLLFNGGRRRGRMIATSGTAFVLAASGLTAAAPGVGAAQVNTEGTGQRFAAEGTARAHPATPRGRGFAPVRTTAAPAVAMTSPAPDELWVAERAADGTVILEHRSGHRWRTLRLPVAVDAATRLDGTASDDVWLASTGTLWHYDGRRWTRVRVPLGAGLTVSTVTDLPGPDAYVGIADTRSPQGGAEAVYRVRGSRWTSLGRPHVPGQTWGYRPIDIAVRHGRVLAVWGRASAGRFVHEEAFTHDGRRRKDPMTLTQFGGGSVEHRGAWLGPDRRTQVVLGERSDGRGFAPMCRVWRSGAEGACRTRWAVGGADALRNGQVVVGGNDDTRATPPAIQAGFGLRAPDGTERVLSGGPGAKTVAVEAEPGTNTAWAITVPQAPRGAPADPTRARTVLQRYVG